jgi:hypothetical protein
VTFPRERQRDDDEAKRFGGFEDARTNTNVFFTLPRNPTRDAAHTAFGLR